MTIESHSTSETGILSVLVTGAHSTRSQTERVKKQENLPIDFQTYVPKLSQRFEIVERMGGDETGVVFKVYDLEYDRTAAVKVLPYFSLSQSAEARLMRDLKALVGVRHPNILEVYDYGRSHDGALYMVMDYFAGESLASLIDRTHGLDSALAEDILFQIADALSYAHRKGIIHRDIRPANVLVGQTADGRELAKVIDFGIAKTVAETIPTELRAKSSANDSKFYNSPEQIRGNVFDPRCDIYSLGCLMYEVVSGKPPFDNDEGHLSKTPAPLGQKRNVSSRLESCISRCLEKQPQDRFKYADAVIYHLTSKVVNEEPPKLGPRVSWTKLLLILGCASTLVIPFAVSRSFSFPLWICLAAYAVAAFLVILAVVQNQDLAYRLRTRQSKQQEE